jgi:hypothetical protein
MVRIPRTHALFVAGLTCILLCERALAQIQAPLPPAEEIVARMLVRDNKRRSAFSGYTVLRQYQIVNKPRHAEMLVRLVCSQDGGKRFQILHEEGSGFIRNHVIRKMLKEEAKASHRETRESTRIIPANYWFRVAGMDAVEGRPAYVLEITPKTKAKYLIRGRIWVDASDYAITRIEGSPAKKPSFWTRSVHFIHTYEKVNSFWFAASTWSVTDVRIFGKAELWINDFGYLPTPEYSAELQPLQARLMP